MMIISFAETTPALLAGRKTVTRREWNPTHAGRFKAGQEVQAWSKGPRVKGARRVGTIRITRTPYIEESAAIPDEDWEGEGFAFMETNDLRLFGGMTPRAVWDAWHSDPTPLWVVRFEVVRLEPELRGPLL